jgi:hypothetical protein
VAFGPYGKIDWPAPCDPEWSDYMGVCSDDTGTPLKADGTPATFFEIQSEILRRPAVTAAPGGAAPSARPGAQGFEAWLRSGYNAIYAALGFVALLMLLGAMKGGRR